MQSLKAGKCHPLVTAIRAQGMHGFMVRSSVHAAVLMSGSQMSQMVFEDPQVLPVKEAPESPFRQRRPIRSKHHAVRGMYD